LNGNKSTAPINLKTRVMVSPTILNGRRINQMSGNRKIRTKARGQQSTRRMHQRIMASRVFILFDSFLSLSTNASPVFKVLFLRSIARLTKSNYTNVYTSLIKNVQ